MERSLRMPLEAGPKRMNNIFFFFFFQKSDYALLAESEVNLGLFINSKASLTYLFESDPLHLLAGLHLQFNDFVMQASHTLDFSRSNRVVILVSFIYFRSRRYHQWSNPSLFNIFIVFIKSHKIPTATIRT